MKRVVTILAAAVAVLAASSPARAQSWEVSGFIGNTPSADLERRAPELDELAIRGGFTWGAQAARLFTSQWAAEVLWTEQASALTADTAAGTADFFTMTIRHVHGNVVYHLGEGNARLRPFVFGGLGATFFSADDLESETKLSFGLGAGVKYFLRDAIGLRAHFRYKPSMLNDEDAADFCDPFGFCQGTLSQIEFAGGGVVRF